MQGKINHSVCAWCFADMPLEALCQAASELGIQSVELLLPDEFAVAKKYGLTCAMVGSIGPDWDIPRGWNRVEHHAPLIHYYQGLIDATAEAGFTHVVCFSGNREGLDDEQGLENCAIGLRQLMPYAAAKKVTITMEMLNSKIDHPDYQCDHTAWGVELCKRVDNEYFKLLYDIYHMQIMEGDVIRNIQEHHAHIAHYHTGGVPGRNEIDETQELYYPAIMKAIYETGFKGFVGQEFVPAREDKLASLKQGLEICDI